MSVSVSALCDGTGDGDCDSNGEAFTLTDYITMQGLLNGSLPYTAKCDFNNDTLVNLGDFVTFIGNYSLGGYDCANAGPLETCGDGVCGPTESNDFCSKDCSPDCRVIDVDALTGAFPPFVPIGYSCDTFCTGGHMPFVTAVTYDNGIADGLDCLCRGLEDTAVNCDKVEADIATLYGGPVPGVSTEFSSDCGNGVLDAGEDCDASIPFGKLGPQPGIQLCSDSSACPASCTGCPAFICGDADGDGTFEPPSNSDTPPTTGDDAIYLWDFIFSAGPSCVGGDDVCDLDNSSGVNIADFVRMITYFTDATSLPLSCPGGVYNAVCGDGPCEASSGETSFNCPSDCGPPPEVNLTSDFLPAELVTGTGGWIVEQEAPAGDVIATEIVEMQLTGSSEQLGDLTVRVSSGISSEGEIEGSGAMFPATSFFDVYFEIDFDVDQNGTSDITLHNNDAVQLTTTLYNKPWAPQCHTFSAVNSSNEIELLDAANNTQLILEQFIICPLDQLTIIGSVAGFPETISATDEEVQIVLSDGTVDVTIDKSSGTLDLSNATITSEIGKMTVTGLDLGGGTKTIEVQVPESTTELCVVDTEGATTIDAFCANGVTVPCPGTEGAYTCVINGTIATVSGLSNTVVGTFTPAPSTGGGSSSGSGGGSGTSRTPASREIVLDELEPGKIHGPYDLPVGSTIRFSLQGVSHEIEVTQYINSRVMSFTARSTPKDFLIAEGQFQELQFKQGLVRVYLDEIIDSGQRTARVRVGVPSPAQPLPPAKKADIPPPPIIEVPKPVPEPVPEPVVEEPVVVPEPVVEPVEEKEPFIVFTPIVGGIALLIIVIAVIIYALQRMPERPKAPPKEVYVPVTKPIEMKDVDQRLADLRKAISQSKKRTVKRKTVKKKVKKKRKR